MIMRSYRNNKAAFLLVCLLCLATLAASDDRKKDNPWVPMEERIKVWDPVVAQQLRLTLPLGDPKPYRVSANGLEATFEKDGAQWTIIGANAPIVNPTVYPGDWPVKGDDFEVLVIPEPITNYKILPFTEKIENAVKSDTISVTAALDSYEPASFVIRSGGKELTDVRVAVSDLKTAVKAKDGKTKAVVLPKNNIDVRVVKCWYQAGEELNDTKHKMLKPELLLHDDRLVISDYERQISLIRNYEKVQDAVSLQPIVIPKRENKQLWITLKMPTDQEAGDYQGVIHIKDGGKDSKTLTLIVKVLPFTLPQPIIDYALYYEGYISDEPTPRVEAHRKTRSQLLFDLLDMKEHGLTNATLSHRVSPDRSKWPVEWDLLQKTLDVRKKIGWGAKPLLYLDWKTVYWANPKFYKDKISHIVNIAKVNKINDVFIYGLDEKKDDDFASIKHVYTTVHEAGAKNYVAMTENTYLNLGFDLIDIPIFWGIPGIHIKNMEGINKKGKRVWKYSQPQAGLEYPAAYRRNYGVKLLVDEFAGACDYQYQRGSWNDFADPHGRMNTMAYPTVTKPVPTIQWEGWRAGVNDVRYITYMKNHGLLDDSSWLTLNCGKDFYICRKEAVGKILRNAIHAE
jgi:hypothetical protein